MSDEPCAIETLVQETSDTSQLQKLKKNQARLLAHRPLAHLVETENRIKEQAELDNEWRTRTNLWTYAVKPEKDIGFCHLLNYPKSNCNHRRYSDGNCFETKAPGCRDGKIYLKLKKFTGKQEFSLLISSYLSRFIDFISLRK